MVRWMVIFLAFYLRRVSLRSLFGEAFSGLRPGPYQGRCPWTPPWGRVPPGPLNNVSRLKLEAVFFSMALVFLSLSAQAQEATLEVSDGPYYMGSPIVLQVTAQGFEEEPQPTIEVSPPAAGQLQLVGVSPEVNSSVQIVNGRMSQWKSVRFRYSYRFIAEKTGRITVGPFRVRQGKEEAVTESFTFTLGDIPTGGQQRLRLLLPEKPVFLGQRVPIQLEWWIHPDMVEKLVRQEAMVPLFDQTDTFRFVDAEETESKSALVINTPSGAMKFPATLAKKPWEGETYLVLTVKRTLIPLKSGHHALPPATMVVEQGVRWRRSLFGERTPTQIQKLQVADTPHTLEVKPLPEEGRPGSFSGAVGNGFTLEVQAQRTVVQVGDPIRLILTLRGEDAITGVGLPPLSGPEGLPPQDFRLPERELAGIVENGGKRFEVMARVLHEGVKGIPPLAFSWFDPDLGRYQTTHSQPIALSVTGARMVTAGDVVRNAEAPAEEKTPESEPSSPPQPNETEPAQAPPPSLTLLMGADLSIEQDPQRLMEGGRSILASGSFQVFCYLLGLGLMAWAFWFSKKGMQDPHVTLRQKNLKLQLQSLETAQTPGEVARMLRLMAAEGGEIPRQELNAILEHCDNLAFSPQTQGSGMAREWREKAIHLARRMAGSK